MKPTCMPQVHFFHISSQFKHRVHWLHERHLKRYFISILKVLCAKTYVLNDVKKVEKSYKKFDKMIDTDI